MKPVGISAAKLGRFRV